MKSYKGASSIFHFRSVGWLKLKQPVIHYWSLPLGSTTRIPTRDGEGNREEGEKEKKKNTLTFPRPELAVFLVAARLWFSWHGSFPDNVDVPALGS